MNQQKTVAFLLTTLVSGIFLSLFSYNEEKVAFLRLEQGLLKDTPLMQKIAGACSQFSPLSEHRAEPFLIQRIQLPQADEPRLCRLHVRSIRDTSYFLRSLWSFSVAVQNETRETVSQGRFSIDFPTPLSFIPLVIFFLTVILKLEWIRFSWLAIAYFFLVGGGNIILTSELSLKSLLGAFDPNLMGTLLVVLWVSLVQNHPTMISPRREGSFVEKIPNRLFSSLLGLWNPLLFTVVSKIFFWGKRGLRGILPFFEIQVLLGCLSLYLFAQDLRNFPSTILISLLSPRYFSSAVILFVLFRLSQLGATPQVTVWRLPHFWRTAGLVLLGEILFRYFHVEGAVLTRIGLLLVASELAWPWGIRFTRVMRTFLPSAATVIFCASLPVFNRESGITELAFALWDPSTHPNALALFAFLSGIGFGFLMGNFSSAFFSVAFLLKTSEPAIFQAALLDGILAGNLLSPFSFFNLLPAVNFRISMRELISFRFSQLAVPILIGAAIYALGIMDAVRILQPVSFVFLSLVAFALQLKKRSWTMGGALRGAPV